MNQIPLPAYAVRSSKALEELSRQQSLVSSGYKGERKETQLLPPARRVRSSKALDTAGIGVHSELEYVRKMSGLGQIFPR